ncbi:MAG: hypothetical protein L6R35_002507 [Caloplaca aegaea]|nr:MAG: hypothetical protein L6R35_002507 [Caloplaca aegaea]
MDASLLDIAKPNKTLRMTIRAFLKKILTEREKAQKKQAADKPTLVPPITQARENSEEASTTIPGDSAATHGGSELQASGGAANTSAPAEQSKSVADGVTVPTEAQKDVPQPSIEATEDRVREESFQEQDRGDAAASDLVGKPQNASQQALGSQNVQAPAMANGGGIGQGTGVTTLGFDGMPNDFPNLTFTNSANIQPMMQFMPNNAMGGFPNMMGMPGMPGMGMDPMQVMSQGMFGGFGGPGMGVNGMNAGMGFPAGQMWNGGFNGQPGSWMSGQDKFNQNGYGGHANGMGGDFGANAGYAGYNMPSHQGNYNQMNHQQFPNHDFQNGHHGQGFHNRGRGRGRGYHAYAPRGRGGYNQVTNGSHTNHEPIYNQVPPRFPRQHDPDAPNPQQSEDAEKHQVDEFGRDISGLAKTKEATDDEIARAMAPGDADENESPEAPATTGIQEAPATRIPNDELPKASGKDPTAIQEPDKQDANSDKEIYQPQDHEKPAAIEKFVSDDPSRAGLTSPSSVVAGKTMMPPPTPSIPQAPRSSSFSDNVPHGPSARVQGNGREHSRGSSISGVTGGRRESIIAHDETTNHLRSGFGPAALPMTAPLEPRGVGVEGAPKGPRAMREGLPNTGIRGGRGFSIIGRGGSAAHGRPGGHVRSRSMLMSDLVHHPHAPVPPLNTNLIAIVPTATAPPASRKKAVSVSADASAMNGISVALANTKDQAKKRMGTALRHTSPPTGAVETDPQGGRRNINPTTALTALAAKVDPAPHSSASSRKRHERDQFHEEEDELTRRDRKRSRREHVEEAKPSSRKEVEEEDQHHRDRDRDRDRKRSRRNYAEERSTVTNHAQDEKSSHDPLSSSKDATAHESTPSESKSSFAPTKQAGSKSKPVMDPHELERQARNKERLQKELQRREAMEGKGPRGSKSSNGAGGGALGRRVSYKYEDELEGHDRAEREREAGRWR